MQYNYIHKLTLAKGTLLHNYNVELSLKCILYFYRYISDKLFQTEYS